MVPGWLDQWRTVRHNDQCGSRTVREAIPPGFFVLHTSIGFNTRGRTLRELYDIGQDAYALFGAMEVAN
jgi:hypothetical protein